MEPKPELKPASREASIFARVVLAIAGIICLAFSLHYFQQLRTATGMKLLGLGLWTLGGCFDPVNWLWLGLPFTFSMIVESPKCSRYLWPFYLIGLICILIGWYGDGWLTEPPKRQ